MNHDVGPYLLGLLAPAERREFETHVEGCARCRAEIGELGDLPALLDSVPADLVAALSDGDDLGHAEPPTLLLPSLLRAARAERVAAGRTSGRRRSLLGALVGAAAVLVIAVAVAWHPWNEAPAPVAAVELEQLVDSPVTASVTLEAVAWGTRVSLECRYDGALASVPDDPYGRSGRVYALVVRDVAGNAEQVATWSAVAGTMTVPGATAIPRDQIVEVDLVGADGTALLRAEV